MHSTQKRYLSMFRRARELLTTESANPAVAGPLAELDGVIARMSEHGVTQDFLGRRTRALTVTISDMARTLRRDLLRPAVLAARTVSPSHGNGATALRTIMRMPKHPGDYEELVVAAQALANAVEEHSAAFTAAGLPADFGTRMRSSADALVKAIDTRAGEEQRRIAATQGLRAESQRGGALVRLLDALVEPSLRPHPARLAEWRKAIRIRSFVSGGGASDAPAIPVTPPSYGSAGEVPLLAA